MFLNLNSSLCSSSVKLSKEGGFLLVVDNPLSWEYTWGIRVPVEAAGQCSVTGPDGKPVPSQMLRLSVGSELVWAASKAANEDSNKPTAELALLVTAPPIGHSVYTVTRRAGIAAGDAEQQGEGQQLAAPTSVSTLASNSSVQLSSGKLQLTVGPAGISSVAVAGISVSYSSTLIKYQGNFHGSGAYTFTAGGTPTAPAPSKVVVARGPLVQEVRQSFPDLPGTLTTRLWAGQSHLEVEWTVSPPPATNEWEVFVRYSSSIKSESLWFTDANGREYQQRRRDYRPSFTLPAGATSTHRLPANIYPITSGCYMKDAEAIMNVAVDRAQGAVSMSDGQLDINLHRKSADDDGKGMFQALFDHHVATGTHIVSFGPARDGAATKQGSTRRHYEQVNAKVVDHLQLLQPASAKDACPGQH
uniref:Glycosyl hydrolase family 38 C-terminal domain-containing protein n=1 Tax=Tetradesmus obliquus TaxID=3088 RepID=A0A383VW13_TETOB|eukprot:jgi/Sobl393_1/11770/SZX69053.1